MEQERSIWYTMILGVCAAVSALLLARMALYKPIPVHAPLAPVENAVSGQVITEDTEITFTGGELTALLRAALPEETPVADIRLRLHGNGTLEATGTLEKERLRAVLTSVPRTLFLLMPDSCPLGAVLSAGNDRETGELCLTVEELEAGGFTLPTELSDFLGRQLSDAANQALNARGIHFSGVRISEDQIAFSL